MKKLLFAALAFCALNAEARTHYKVHNNGTFLAPTDYMANYYCRNVNDGYALNWESMPHNGTVTYFENGSWRYNYNASMAIGMVRCSGLGGNGGMLNSGNGIPNGGFAGCQGTLTGAWYKHGQRTRFPVMGKYYRCDNGQWVLN